MENKIFSTHSADEKLAASVSQSLDKSLVDIDELTLQRLKNSRVRALNQSPKPTHKWISLSVAASLAALLVVPVLVHQHSLNTSGDQDVDVVVQEVPFSAEEMDDIDMLMALEDSDA